MIEARQALHRLRALGAGLVFSSEGDHPLDPVRLGAGDLRASAVEEVRRLLALPPETPVTFITLERALGRHTVYTDPEDLEAQRLRPRYEAIERFFVTETADARVVRTGRAPALDVWILGHSADGEVVGYHTVAIET